METKHTKGPWELGASKQSVVKADGQNSKVIASIRTNDHLVNPRFEEGEAEANAQLISSAPDLLEALISAYSFMVIDSQHQGRNILETIKAAIQKATQP